MSRFGSLHQAKGKKFTKQLLYVQHVDKEKDTASTISEQSLDEYLLNNSKIFLDSNFEEYLKSPKSNVDILKSSLQDEKVIYAAVCTNPLPATLKTGVTIHAFVVFGTLNFKTKEKMWYSMEKNGKYIVLQQSPVKDEVTEKLYDPEKKEHVQRLGPVKRKNVVIGNGKELEYLIRAILKTNQLSKKYHLLSSNCQHFASFVIEKATMGEKKWSTWISRRFGWTTVKRAIADRFGLRNKKTKSECPANYYEGKKLSISLNRAKGKNFLNKLLYVQQVDNEKDTASTISEQSLDEYLLNNSQIFSDSSFAEYLRNPEANVDILKSSSQDEKVITAQVCTNRPTFPAIPKMAVTIHAFVVLKTRNLKTNEKMYYSIEKNRQYIVLQQSPVKEDVIYKLYDPEKKKLVQRFGPVKRGSVVRGNGKELEYLLRAIWKTNQLSTKYNLLFSNCQNFAEFVFKEASLGRMKWSTWISRRFGLGNKKSQTEIEADTLKYHRRKDAKFAYYKAMAEGRRQDFEKLAGNLTRESLNSVDSDGYTLLEWATAFSTPDWPIDQFLREKGAEIQTDAEGLFRRNVFFIALQYFPSKKESRYLSFDGIDIHGVNQTGDSALHLALYGQKWDVAERILDQFPDYNVNVTNSLGRTPLHLAVHPKCKMVLNKKILARMNSKNVNAQNKGGWTALHVAIVSKSEIAVKELLKRDDVDVNLKKNNNATALHYACFWKDIPIDLFTKILEKSTDVNAQDEDGWTALHFSIIEENKTAVKVLLKQMDVNVNLKNNQNQTALHVASVWKNIPIDLFKIILEKTTDVNAQQKYGHTALHWAIIGENRTAVEELLKRDDVDVNLKNKNNQTALHLACCWNDMPIDLFTIILENSTDVNAQEIEGHTALQCAIFSESKIAVKELLNHEDVDVNLKNNNYTILDCAAWWKNIPIDLLTKILEKSANVNAQNEGGRTALHLAIALENRNAVEELLKHKDVKVNLKNNHNVTALQFASVWKNIPVDLFRVILTKLADVINAKDEDGDTALHLAIIGKNKTTVEELLKRDDVNENVNLINNYNYTILHVASVWKNIPIDLFIKILEETTDVNAKDEVGNTALHWAIMSKSEIATNQLLNHNNADVTIKNHKNQTALNLCSKWKDIPANLLKIINEKTTAENKAEDQNEAT